MSNLVELSIEYYPESDEGKPISGGDLYVGVPDTDPEVVGNQVQVQALQENGSFVNMTQPITLSAGGVPLYNGSAVSLYVPGDYSLKVLDTNGSQVYYVPSTPGLAIIPGNYYYPDYSESDHGVTGNNGTIKYYVDQIGTYEATLYFKHNSGNQFTDYILNTAETIPDNIKLEFEPGARIKPAVGISLTVYSMNNIKAGKRQQIVDITNNSTNPFIFTIGGGELTPNQLVDNTTPGTTLMDDAIQLAIDIMNTAGSGIVHLLAETYAVDAGLDEAAITIKSNVTLKGEGISSVLKGVSSNLLGAIIGSSAGAVTDNFVLKNFKVDYSGANMGHGMRIGGGTNIIVDNIFTVGSASPTVAAGAIAFSSFDEYLQYPVIDITIKNCIIEKPGNFGINIGYGDNILIKDNIVKDAFRQAIGLEVNDDSGTYGALYIKDAIISDNIVNLTENSNHFGGSNGPGLLVGATSSDLGFVENILVTDNVIRGSEINVSYAATISVIGATTTYTEHVVVRDNEIYNVSGKGIGVGAAGQNTRKISILDNLIVDCDTAAQSVAAIELRNSSQCVVKSNIIRGSNHDYMVEESNLADNNYIGKNYGDSGTSGDYNIIGSNTIYDIYPENYLADGESGKTEIETATVDDDGTHTFTARGVSNRAIYFLVSNFDHAAQCIFVANSNASIEIIAQSAAGTCTAGIVNPDVDGKLNIWTASTTTIAIKNRLGSQRVFSLVSITSQSA